MRRKFEREERGGRMEDEGIKVMIIKHFEHKPTVVEMGADRKRYTHAQPPPSPNHLSSQLICVHVFTDVYSPFIRLFSSSDNSSMVE